MAAGSDAQALPAGVPRPQRLAAPSRYSRGARAARLARTGALALGGSAALLWAFDAGLLQSLAVLVPASALACVGMLRFPTAAITLTFFVFSFHGTLLAYVGPVPVRPAVIGMIVGLILATAARYISGRRVAAAHVWPGVLLLSAYLLLTGLMVFRAENLSQSLDGYSRQMLYPAFFLALAYAQFTQATRMRIVKGITSAMIAAMAYAMFRYATGPGQAELAIITTYDVVDDTIALFGALPGRQEFGGYVAIVLPVLLCLAIGLTGPWRYACLAGATAAAIGVFACQTRVATVGAALGITVAALLLLGMRASAGRRPLIALAIVICAVAGAASYTAIIADDPSRASRYANILDPTDDPSGSNHIEKWRAAAREVQGDPLGLGIGASGTAGRIYARFQSVDTIVIDSSYVSLAYQHGWWLLVLFLLAILGILYGLAKGALLQASRFDAALAVAGVAAITSWLALLSTGIFIERYCTLVAMTIAGLAAAPLLTGRYRRRTDPPAEPASV